MKFECPQCAQHLEGDPEIAGQEIPCPSCGHSIKVPMNSAVTAKSPAPNRNRSKISWMVVAAGLIVV